MTNFTHYLVTRFNIKIDQFGPELFRPDARTEDWELKRLPLFEKFCVPSVAGQTNQNFTWLIYCDPATSSEIMQLIKKALQAITNYEVIFVEGFDAMLDHLKHKVAYASTPFVISSRLDNDDGLGKNYVQFVQTNFVPEDHVILNQLGGINYNHLYGILTFHHYYARNSFISLIEKKKDPDQVHTVFGFRHLSPKKEMTVLNIRNKYSFWMNLHGDNAAIRGNSGWPIPLSTAAKHYTFDTHGLLISPRNTIAYTLRWFPFVLKRKIKYLLRTRLALLKNKMGYSKFKRSP